MLYHLLYPLFGLNATVGPCAGRCRAACRACAAAAAALDGRPLCPAGTGGRGAAARKHTWRLCCAHNIIWRLPPRLSSCSPPCAGARVHKLRVDQIRFRSFAYMPGCRLRRRGSPQICLTADVTALDDDDDWNRTARLGQVCINATRCKDGSL